MDLIRKVYLVHNIFNSRRTPITRTGLEQKMGASRSTVYRVISFLREHGAPIVQNRLGYQYDHTQAYELPGLWFTKDELIALKTAYDLLTNSEPSLLRATLQPLQLKIEQLLSNEYLGAGQLRKRVRIIRHAGRGSGAHFNEVMRSLVERKQLLFDYTARTSGNEAQRKVSPQRLTHYRENWYLDAWCHDRKALRSFALERIQDAKVSRLAARDVDEKRLDEHLASAYGIFAGQPVATARLLFSAHRAQWVSQEKWHPDQSGVQLKDGRYQLDIPYSDTRELIMDILKYGSDVEVLSPAALRAEVQIKLIANLKIYENTSKPAPDKGSDVSTE